MSTRTPNSKDIRFIVVRSPESLVGVLDMDEARVCPFAGDGAESMAAEVAAEFERDRDLRVMEEFGWLPAKDFFGAES